MPPAGKIKMGNIFIRQHVGGEKGRTTKSATYESSDL